jgi:sec-independent protein translocase protein TatC
MPLLHAINRSTEKDALVAKKNTQPGDPPPKKGKGGAKARGNAKKPGPPASKKIPKKVSRPGKDTPPDETAPVVDPRSGQKGGSGTPAATGPREAVKKGKAAPPVAEKPGGPPEEIDPEATSRGDTPMTLVGHLSEMRTRLLVVLGSVLVVMLVGFGFSDHLMMLINRPFMASGQKLNLFTLFEGFTLRLKSSLFVSVLVCLPLIMYQVWKYIEPAINRNDRTMIRLTLLMSVFLFYLGVSFTYLFLPVAIMALMAFAPTDMLITNNATEYFNFFVMTALILGAVFELPIVMLLLTKMGIVSPALLTSKRKYAIVIIWITAALVSPGPDPLSQALLALPLMLLYELSIVISKIIVRRKKKKELAGER